MENGHRYLALGILIGVTIWVSSVYHQNWYMDEIQHILGGVGIGFIFMGLGRLKNINTGPLMLSVFIIGIAGSWEVYEFVHYQYSITGDWPAPVPEGMWFWMEDTMLDMALAFVGAFAIREKFGFTKKSPSVKWVYSDGN